MADQTIARYRDRKTNRTHLLVGGDTEVDATSRSSAKPVFEGDVVTNFEWMVSRLSSCSERGENWSWRKDGVWNEEVGLA